MKKQLVTDTTMLTVRHEATLTSNGNCFHGNRKPIIAVDLYEVFNSSKDFMIKYHVSKASVYKALHGQQNDVTIYKVDENGNKIDIGKTRLTFAAHMETAMDAVMKNGRNEKQERNKANEKLAKAEKKATMFDAIVAEQKRKNKIKHRREKRIRMLNNHEVQIARLRKLIAQDDAELDKIDSNSILNTIK